MGAQVHMTVDTAMDTGSLRIAAYIARKLNLGEQKLARKFQEVECEIDTEEIETVGGAHPTTVYSMQGICQVVLLWGSSNQAPEGLLERAALCIWCSACFISSMLLSSVRYPHHAVDTLKKDGAAPLPKDLDGLQKTLDRLQEVLSRAHTYAEDVAVSLPRFLSMSAPSCCLCHNCSSTPCYRSSDMCVL